MNVREIAMFRKTDVMASIPTSAYSFNRDRGFVWVQRLCFWVLGKLRCSYYDSAVVDVERHLIDPDRFIDRFFEAYDELDLRYGRRPRIIYIGSDDYAELMAADGMSMPYSFRAEFMVGNNGHRSFHGISVEVIPWMSGVLVV